MDIQILCRVCFAGNVRMHAVVETPLQELYEKLTNVKLTKMSSTAGHSSVLCCMCHAHLRRCYSFQQAATRAEELLAQLYLDGVAITQDVLSIMEHPPVHKYARTPVECITIYSDTEIQQRKQIKQEAAIERDDGSQENDVNEPSEETSGGQLKLEYELDHMPVGAENDSDEDLPLHVMKNIPPKRKKEEEEKKKKEKKRGYSEPSEETSGGQLKLEYGSDHMPVGAETDSDEDLPLHVLKSIPPKRRKEGERKKRGYSDCKLDAREIVLTYEQQKEAMSARASSLNYLNSPHRCSLCYRGFINLDAYTNHMEKHVESSGAHACPLCCMRYRSARLLRAHAHASHSRQYSCNKCGHTSNTRHQASDHERLHSGNYYECKLCGKSFHARTSYLTHVRSAHAGGAAMVCAACGGRFVSAHGLRMHAARAHVRGTHEEESSPPESRYCAPCGVQFETHRAWSAHLLSTPAHRQRAASTKECPICAKEIESPMGAHLAQHDKELKRARARPPEPAGAAGPTLDCDQCELRFAGRARLAAHVRRVHLGLRYDKHLVCELCGKNCTSAATLRYHQRTHTGERPHGCSAPACGKRFSDANQLRIHTRTHTGERPYACEHCARRFAQKPALNRHYRVHTGAKPYTCDLCTKSFSQSNSLNTHVKAVHLKMSNAKKRARTTGARKHNDDKKPRSANVDTELTSVIKMDVGE